MSTDPDLNLGGAKNLGAHPPQTRMPTESDLAPTEPPTAEDAAAAAASRELSEEVPVPIAMWPSEIDERGRVVEAIEDEKAESRPSRLDNELNR